MADWFYQSDGREIGPITSVALKKLVESSAIRPNDMVRRSDMKKWYMAKNVIGLFPPKIQTHLGVNSRSTTSTKASSLENATDRPSARSPDAPRTSVLYKVTAISLGLSGCVVMVFVLLAVFGMDSAKYSSATEKTEKSVVDNTKMKPQSIVDPDGTIDNHERSGNNTTVKDGKDMNLPKLKQFEETVRSTYQRHPPPAATSGFTTTDSDLQEGHRFTGLDDGVSWALNTYPEGLPMIRLYTLARIAGKQKEMEDGITQAFSISEDEIQSAIEKRDSADLVGRASMYCTIAIILNSPPAIVEGDYRDIVQKTEPQYRSAFVREYSLVRSELAQQCRDNALKILNRLSASGLQY